RLVDGTGGGGSVKSLDTMGRTYVPFNPGWDHVVANLATVPVVALALGSVAGLGAARVVSSHLAVMVQGTSQVFVAGPPVVARLGEEVDKEGLGGSAIHGRNGVVDDVVASDAYVYGGGWTAEASQKIARFVDLADTFHLPVVHLVDQPGFVIGTTAEKAATIRHGARALAAVYQASVPWCSVVLRRVFGVA